MSCTRVAIAAAFALLLAADLPAAAQNYPSKPVKVVVSHAAGLSGMPCCGHCARRRSQSSMGHAIWLREMGLTKAVDSP